jgi:PAS domain S-box-containing protein
LRPRHIAAVALVLGLTVAGFIVARVLAERDARHNSERRVEIAAAHIRSRVEGATSLTESLRRFMLDEGSTGVRNDEFTRNALRWLSPAEVPAAAWAEEVQAADRAAYERRIGQPIVMPGERGKAVPPGTSYLPATLVSGYPPMDSRGIDLRRELGIAAALGRAIRPGGVGATPIAARSDGTRGLFLVAPAPNLIDGVLRPGAVVVFLPEANLRAAARNPPGLRFPPVDRSSGDRAGGDTVRDAFAVAGQRFAVVMPKEAVSGPGAVLPWVILAGGLLLALFAGALGVIAARRARAQRDFDRIFNLSPDLVAVADFDGHFTRVNPAAEQILGYTEEELLTRPYLDLVHPNDRERTAAEAAAIGEGKRTVSFQNRYARKDGSYRVLEWTSIPVVEERTMYTVARDVTDRRTAEAEVERLADEQAALRRVATVVARGGSRAEVFGAIAEEVRLLFGNSLIYMFRYEDERAVVAVASAGFVKDVFPVGSRHELGGNNAATHVFRTGEPVRIDDYATAGGPIAEAVRPTNTRSVIGAPIVVDERLWGVMVVGTTDDDPLPPATESRVGQFTELMATAIANAESREALARLADEQAALSRVATLVAEGAAPTAVFDAVAGEMEALLEADQVALNRFEAGGEIGVLAHRGLHVERTPVGSHVSYKGEESVTATVHRTGRPARTAQGLRVSAGAPIVVDGRLWGIITASWKGEQSPPPDTEERMAHFAQLVDTAIANADSRDQLEASRARLLSAGDEARRRVVRDLHDGAQQRLVHTIVTLKLAQRAFHEDDGKAEYLLGEALGHAERSNEELRELAHGILPTALSNGGLRASVDAFAGRLDLSVQVDVPADRFPAEVEASAYFIVAEALTNVVKHSHAKRAEVKVSADDELLRVEVRDDGMGGADPDGHGLEGLADRATALGGRLEIESPAGGGTLVTAAIPLAG